MSEYVPYLVIFFVVIFFCFRIVQLVRSGVLAKRQIDDCVALLASLERGNLVANFGRIDDKFRATELLRHPWCEFNDSLVKRADETFSTTQADHFFSEEALVQSPLGVDFNRHVPGIFTALGIVGTFFGISSGLTDALVKLTPKVGSDQDPGASAKALTDATQTLLAHVSPAFQASLCAVLLAVLFLFVERSFTNLVSHSLHRLQSEIDRLFPGTTSEAYLRDLVDQSNQQTKHMSAFKTDLAEVLKESLSLLVSQQVAQLQTSNRDLVNTIGDRMGDQLKPVTENLQRAVDKLKEDQASSTHETLQRMVDQFSQALVGNAQGQMQQMAKAIEGTSETMATVKQDLHTLVVALSEQNARQMDLMNEQIAKLQKQSVATQEDAERRSSEFLRNMSEQLLDMQKQFRQGAGASLNQVQEDLASMVQRSLKTQQDVASDLITRVGETQGQISLQVKEVLQAIQSSASQNAAQMGRSQSDALRTLQDVMSGTQGSMERLIDQVTKSTSDNMKSLTDSMSSVAANMQETTRLLSEQVRNNTESSLEKLTVALSEHLSDAMQNLSNQVEESTQNISGTSSRAAADMSNETVKAIVQLREQLSHALSDMNGGILRLVDSSNRTNNELTTRFKDLADLHQLFATRTNEGVGALSLTLSSTSDRLANFLKELTTLAQTYGTQLTSQREISGQLGVVTQKLAESAASIASYNLQANGTTQLMQRVVTSLKDQYELGSQQLEHFKTVTTSLGEAANQVSQQVSRQSISLEQVETQGANLFRKMDEDLVRYYNHTSTSLKDFLGTLDEYTSKATAAFSGSVDELGDNVEELNELVSRMTGPLATGSGR